MNMKGIVPFPARNAFLLQKLQHTAVLHQSQVVVVHIKRVFVFFTILNAVYGQCGLLFVHFKAMPKFPLQELQSPATKTKIRPKTGFSKKRKSSTAEKLSELRQSQTFRTRLPAPAKNQALKTRK